MGHSNKNCSLPRGRLRSLQVDFQTHRAVVGAEDIAVNGGSGDFVRNAVGYQEIVDAPAGVILPGLEHIAPPGIGTGGVRVQIAEAVRKAAAEQHSEGFPFFVGESGIAPVGGRILQVDFLVCHIQIAADDDGFAFVQFVQISPEGRIPFHPVVKPCKSTLGGGCVAGDQIEIIIFEGDESALGVQLFHADAVGHMERFSLAENGGAGITLLFGVVPVFPVAGQIHFHLLRLQFGFLQAASKNILTIL